MKGVGSGPCCPDVLKLTFLNTAGIVTLSAIALKGTFITSTSGSYLLPLAVSLIFLCDVNLVLDCKPIYIEGNIR